MSNQSAQEQANIIREWNDQHATIDVLLLSIWL